jgi:DNA polymerase-3 subunit beta
MRLLTIPQRALKTALKEVAVAIGSTHTLPILGNMLLATDGTRLKLAATNLEIAITRWIDAPIDHAGAITVPARLLTDLVSDLPDEPVALVLDTRTQTLHLQCAGFSGSLHGIAADEFPTLPQIVGTPVATVTGASLRTAIKQVAFAAATDDTRPVLAGVLLRLAGTNATLTATDGLRLTLKRLTLAEPVTTPQDLIIPARALTELARIIADRDDPVAVTVTPAGNAICFSTATTQLVARLIDGSFPDFERIIPTSYTTRTVLDMTALRQAVKLASYVATASAGIVKLAMEPGSDLAAGRLTISANAAAVGDNQTALDALIAGAGAQIALHVELLADALAAVPTPQIALEIQTAQSPAVVRAIGDDTLLQLLMPMAVR